MKSLNNAAIFEKLHSINPKDNDEAMTYLYATLYKKVQAHIMRNKGYEHEAKDVFQDALLAFYDLVQSNKVSKDTNIEAYIFSICRYIWVKELKKRKQASAKEVENLHIPVDDFILSEVIDANKSELLRKVLKELGQGCEQILIAFYLHGATMEEIVALMDLSSVQVAKNKKYKCLQRLRKLILNSEYYKNNLFNE